MKKIIVNTHKDTLDTEDVAFIEAYQKRAAEILSFEWDVIEFENVPTMKSWRYQVNEYLIDDDLATWTQEAIERAYQEAQA